jgi:hypothetical protein
MAAPNVQHYRSRARDFLDGMRILRDDLDNLGWSSALLGIHGAMSYCDALRTGMGSKSLYAGDHKKAAVELQSLLDSRRFEKQQGVKHFKRLLECKTKISYAAERVGKNEIEDIVMRATRFADWAEETGKALRIEGW